MTREWNFTFSSLLTYGAATYCSSCTSVFQTSSSHNSRTLVALFPSCPCPWAPHTWSWKTQRGITIWIFNRQRHIGQACSFLHLTLAVWISECVSCQVFPGFIVVFCSLLWLLWRHVFMSPYWTSLSCLIHVFPFNLAVYLPNLSRVTSKLCRSVTDCYLETSREAHCRIRLH